MHVDDKTLYDLGVISRYEQHSILHYVDFTVTSGGKDWLRYFITKPMSRLDDIKDRQRLLRHMTDKVMPAIISNGTMMVMDKYYYSPITNIPTSPSGFDAVLYRWLSRPDYVQVRYSIGHLAKFVHGMNILHTIYAPECPDGELKELLEKVGEILESNFFQKLGKIGARVDKGGKLTGIEVIKYGHQLYQYTEKNGMKYLEEAFLKIDAWSSMARAVREHQLTFPELIESQEPLLQATGLYHPLLETAVAYDIALEKKENFLFLTGANMAGKSTFIRAVGIGLYLAALGMGVPASYMKCSTFDGLLSNIEVTDNTLNGESYFFNEVQRVKTIVEKIQEGSKWLILIDELFKGTNIVDAMKCSTTVVEGLRKVDSSIFILSTHLYEIGEPLRKYQNIQFRYFETEVIDDNLIFSYQLREGISNDRLGYLILQREKVTELLNNL
ncbi:MutS domain III [Arachidicoccus rhizosphaerae]|uniref:MutS domain III n=1 Tax=Arachidicoccus rhizosphaerae TaxID=551991 RepID=A0A1H3XGK4_9BACT|nr:hypothetical protein [Arachidicoccus rhizosphaerae]SDZ98489.1 MutS domain III [Arachidicoccus rhizosphaerae]